METVATPIPQATVSAPVVAAQPPAMNNVSALDALQGTLEQIYANVNPSVVNIQVTTRQSVNTSEFSFPQIPGFPNIPNQQGPQDFYSQGSGSGFVWDKEGHIVTNNHVVEGADKIMVTFADDTTVSGKVVGTDKDSDLAVIQVDMPADKLQPVQLADSTQLKIGQLAIAIGNPFALEGTMTVGFVSALGRLLPVETNGSGPQYNIPDVIQTDASINPGNSGGVLVDENGQVIGVTSAIISPVQASAGIGFAIPSAIVQKVAPALISQGYYEHSYLGVTITSLTPDLAQEMDLQADQQGALVVDVVSGSPAEAANLRGSSRQVTIDGQDFRVGGDVIVAIDDQPVHNSDDIITYLARHTEVGQTVTLKLLRNGKEETADVLLAARPQSTPTAAQQAANDNNSSGGVRLGILGLSLTPSIAEAMNLPSGQEGVLVEQVEAGSAADLAGLQGSFKPVTVNGDQLLVGGDVITGFNNETVKSVESLQGLLRQTQPGDEVTLTILRDGEEMQVTVTFGE